jgi:16S rRNA processing protein RimM
MRNFDQYFYLGKIVKPHGFQGRVSVFLDTDDPDNYLETKIIYININGAPVPYFVEEIKLLNNKATILFQDVTTEEQAEKLLKKDMYLPLSELPKLTGNQFYYHEINGMSIIDEEKGLIGVVNEVLEYSSQAIIQTFFQGKEVLIPISDDIIKLVDRENHRLHLQLPEGLLEVYLNE